MRRYASVLVWCELSALSAIAISWLSAQIHASGHAPVGLTSFFVGALLGIVVGAIAASLKIRSVRTLIIGAIAFALITIVAEHAWLYRDYCRQWEEARTRSVAAATFPNATPPTMAEWFNHEWNLLHWLTDAALITITAAATSVSASRYRIVKSSSPNTQPPALST
jgi:ABC-type uncharacterized transport system permease subunit